MKQLLYNFNVLALQFKICVDPATVATVLHQQSSLLIICKKVWSPIGKLIIHILAIGQHLSADVWLYSIWNEKTLTSIHAINQITLFGVTYTTSIFQKK